MNIKARSAGLFLVYAIASHGALATDAEYYNLIDRKIGHIQEGHPMWNDAKVLRMCVSDPNFRQSILQICRTTASKFGVPLPTEYTPKGSGGGVTINNSNTIGGASPTQAAGGIAPRNLAHCLQICDRIASRASNATSPIDPDGLRKLSEAWGSMASCRSDCREDFPDE